MQDYLSYGNRIKRQQPTEKSPFRQQTLNTRTHLSSEHVSLISTGCVNILFKSRRYTPVAPLGLVCCGENGFL